MWKYQKTDELYHHGILGMKWGVRRYQNKDGSLTPAGRRKAAKMKDQYTALTGKKLIRKPSTKSVETANQNKKKSIKDLTDTELNNKINRLQKEKQLAGLQADTANKGQKFVSTVGKQVVAPAAIEAGKRVLTDLFVKIGKDKLGLNPENAKDALSQLKKETEFAELRNRKDKAEREYNNRLNKEKKKQESSSSKEETVKTEFVKNNKTSDTSSKRKDSTIIDAEWKEVSPNSREIVPYTQKGESYIDDWFKNKRR